MLDYEINIRAVLSCFYHGTGTSDIGSGVSFLGVPGGLLFDRTANNHSEYVNSQISSVCQAIIKEGLTSKIKTIIKHRLVNEYSEEEIDVHIHHCINNEGDIPEKNTHYWNCSELLHGMAT